MTSETTGHNEGLQEGEQQEEGRQGNMNEDTMKVCCRKRRWKMKNRKYPRQYNKLEKDNREGDRKRGTGTYNSRKIDVTSG